MSVTIPTKDGGDGCVVYRRSLEVKETFEDRSEKFIKQELGIRD